MAGHGLVVVESESVVVILPSLTADEELWSGGGELAGVFGVWRLGPA